MGLWCHYCRIYFNTFDEFYYHVMVVHRTDHDFYRNCMSEDDKTEPDSPESVDSSETDEDVSISNVLSENSLGKNNEGFQNGSNYKSDHPVSFSSFENIKKTPLVQFLNDETGRSQKCGDQGSLMPSSDNESDNSKISGDQSSNVPSSDDDDSDNSKKSGDQSSVPSSDDGDLDYFQKSTDEDVFNSGVSTRKSVKRRKKTCQNAYHKATENSSGSDDGVIFNSKVSRLHFIKRKKKNSSLAVNGENSSENDVNLGSDNEDVFHAEVSPVKSLKRKNRSMPNVYGIMGNAIRPENGDCSKRGEDNFTDSSENDEDFFNSKVSNSMKSKKKIFPNVSSDKSDGPMSFLHFRNNFSNALQSQRMNDCLIKNQHLAEKRETVQDNKASPLNSVSVPVNQILIPTIVLEHPPIQVPLTIPVKIIDFPGNQNPSCKSQIKKNSEPSMPKYETSSNYQSVMKNYDISCGNQPSTLTNGYLNPKSDETEVFNSEVSPLSSMKGERDSFSKSCTDMYNKPSISPNLEKALSAFYDDFLLSYEKEDSLPGMLINKSRNTADEVISVTNESDKLDNMLDSESAGNIFNCEVYPANSKKRKIDSSLEGLSNISDEPLMTPDCKKNNSHNSIFNDPKFVDSVFEKENLFSSNDTTAETFVTNSKRRKIFSSPIDISDESILIPNCKKNNNRFSVFNDYKDADSSQNIIKTEGPSEEESSCSSFDLFSDASVVRSDTLPYQQSSKSKDKEVVKTVASLLSSEKENNSPKLFIDNYDDPHNAIKDVPRYQKLDNESSFMVTSNDKTVKTLLYNQPLRSDSLQNGYLNSKNEDGFSDISKEPFMFPNYKKNNDSYFEISSDNKSVDSALNTMKSREDFFPRLVSDVSENSKKELNHVANEKAQSAVNKLSYAPSLLLGQGANKSFMDSQPSVSADVYFPRNLPSIILNETLPNNHSSNVTIGHLEKSEPFNQNCVNVPSTLSIENGDLPENKSSTRNQETGPEVKPSTMKNGNPPDYQSLFFNLNPPMMGPFSDNPSGLNLSCIMHPFYCQSPLPNNTSEGFKMNTDNLLQWYIEHKSFFRKIKYPLCPSLFNKIYSLSRNIFSEYCEGPVREEKEIILKIYKHLNKIIRKHFESISLLIQ